MISAFIFFGLLIVANAYLFIRSRRKIRSRRATLESSDDGEA